MMRPDPPRSALRWLAAAAAGAAIATGFGDRFLDALLPALRVALEWLNPWAEVRRLERTQIDGQWRIAVRLEAVRMLVVGVRPVPPQWGVDVAVAVGALWQAPIVALATAAAWPASWPSRIAASAAALGAGLGCAVLLVAVAVTGIALGGIHGALAADQPVPFLTRLPRFLEAGGRLMAGFVVGVVALAAVAALRRQAHGPVADASTR